MLPLKKPEKKERPEDVLYLWDKSAFGRKNDRLTLIPYNFSLDVKKREKVRGICAVYKDRVECFEDEKKVFELSSEGVDGALFSCGGACASIILTRKEERFTVAAAELRHKKSFGVEAGKLDRYYEEGRYVKTEKKDYSGVCPKCKRPYRPGSSVCTHCGGKKAQFKWLLSMMKPALPMILLSILLFVLFSAAGLIPPRLTEIMVDGYLKNENAGSSEIPAYLLVVLLFFGVTVLQRVFSALRSVLTARIGASIAKRLRAAVFEKVERLTLSAVNRRTAGELMKRITSDTRNVEEFLSSTVGTVVEQLFVLIAVGVIFLAGDFGTDRRLFLLVFLPLIPAALIFWAFHKKIHRIYEKLWKISARSGELMHDIFSGIRVVKTYGKEKEEIDRYERSIALMRDIEKSNETFWGLLSPAVNLLLTAGEFLVLYFVGNRVLGNAMTLGELSKYSMYAAMIYGPLRMMAFLPRRIARTLTSVAKIYDVLGDRDETAIPADPVTKKIEGHIEFKDVTFGYEPGKDVLRHISFEAKPGEMIGLVGRSGVGKSTLINLALRLYDPDEGKVLIDGIDVKELSKDSLGQSVGAVLQETLLFSGTIAQNIAYAKPDATGKEIIEAAKTAGAHEFIMKMPDGYDSYVGEKGNTLSGGEKQRIAIARALLRNPRILILDEATSSLDTATEKKIQDALARLVRGRTTIAIAHRLSTLRNATRIIVLDDKKIAEQGTHEELMRNENGIYYGLVMAQRQMSKKIKK